MAFRRRSGGKSSTIPTDSLSDIAFLLIIFFILTTSIRKLTGFTTDLPAGQRAQAQQLEKTPTVVLRDGALLLDDKAISMEDLRQKLQALHLETRPADQKVILLEASGKADYQQYYDVMASISAANGVVGIIMEETEKAR
jgi:biopolymer transport protein ExbD